MQLCADVSDQPRETADPNTAVLGAHAEFEIGVGGIARTKLYALKAMPKHGQDGLQVMAGGGAVIQAHMRAYHHHHARRVVQRRRRHENINEAGWTGIGLRLRVRNETPKASLPGHAVAQECRLRAHAAAGISYTDVQGYHSCLLGYWP